jgi:bifunctional non-homologous end joining protein LigD
LCPAKEEGPLVEPAFSSQLFRCVVPAQPVKASKPPSGADWVHEIKHDGYRLIVRRDGPTVRLYTRNAFDWTAKLPAIAAAAERIRAKSFTIDGEGGHLVQ